MRFVTVLLFSVQLYAAAVTADLAEVRPGPVSVAVSGEMLVVRWPDETARTWIAEFSLDPAKPLINRVALQDHVVIRDARPQYWASTGKRRGRAGFDEFFVVLAHGGQEFWAGKDAGFGIFGGFDDDHETHCELLV